MADGVQNSNTTRAMGLPLVNAHQVTSVEGLEPDHDSEFVISRLNNLNGKTSDAHRSEEHRGNLIQRTHIDDHRAYEAQDGYRPQGNRG